MRPRVLALCISLLATLASCSACILLSACVGSASAGADRPDAQHPQLRREDTKPAVAAAVTSVARCRLVSHESGQDVSGKVALRAELSSAIEAEVTFLVDGRAVAEARGVRGVAVALWDTTRDTAEGPHELHVACAAPKLAEQRSDSTRVWVSNTRGAQLGTHAARLGSDAALDRQRIDALANESKARWLRGGPEWTFHATEADFAQDMEGTARGRPWPALDGLREAATYARTKGVRVLAVALGSPRWAHGRERTDGGNPWHQAILPQHRGAFAEYVKQLCLAGAAAVEVLNEPNLQSEYAFGPDHPRSTYSEERVDDYAVLLRVVYDHVKADPNTRDCMIGTGGTAPMGHELVADDHFIHPVHWYRRLFRARADDRKTSASIRGKFDFASVHPYAEMNTQDGPTEWGHRWTRFFHRYGDAVYAHGMASVHRVRAELLRGGAADKKLWATEVGVATFGGQCLDKPCTSEAKQAEWLEQYVRAWMSTGTTGFRAPLATKFYGDFTGPLIVYQWRDRSDGKIPPTDKEGFFGLLRYDGSKKPAFHTFVEQSQKRR